MIFTKRVLLNIALLLVTASHINRSYAQEVSTRKNKITQFISEKYSVLKSDKETKHGLYQVYFRNNIPLASGEYVNGVKTGTWHFYDTRGRLVENFDYTNNTLLYEAADDSIARSKIFYAFDDRKSDTDRFTKPIKIGGEAFGYIPYLRIYQLPESLYDVNPLDIISTIELLISPGGRLADYKVHINYGDYNSETTFSPEVIDESERIFIPATRNRQPVMSRVFIRCMVNAYGQLDLN